MQCYSKIAENNFNNWSKTNNNEFDSLSFIKCQDFKMMLESGNHIEDNSLLNFFDCLNYFSIFWSSSEAETQAQSLAQTPPTPKS